MPLGDTRAGAPNVQLLQFLFDRQAARKAEERQAQLDQLAQQKAAMEFAAKQAEQRRAEEKHQIEVLKGLRDLAPQIGEGLKSVRGKLTSQDVAEPQGTSLPGDQSFASIVAKNDPQGFSQIPDNDSRLRSLQSDLGTLAGVRASATGQSPDVAADSIVGSGLIANDIQERDLEATIDAEERASEQRIAESILSDNRSELRQIRKERRQREREANKVVDEVRAINRAIVKASDRLENAKTARERKLAFEDLEGLRARKARKEVASTPNAFIVNKLEETKAKREFRNLLDVRAAIAELADRPDLLGPEANIGRFLANVEDIASSLSGVSRRFAEDAILDGDLSPEDKRLVNSVFILGVDPDTGVDIESARLAELYLVWSIEHMLNPDGRTAIAEIRNIRSTSGFTSPLTGSRLATNKLKAALKLFDAKLKNLRQEIRDLNPATQFGPEGQIEGELPPSRILQSSALPPINRDGGGVGGNRGEPTLDDLGF